MSSFLKKQPIFCELSYRFAIDNFQRTGLDVLFYGQEHNDTLAILSKDIPMERIQDLMTTQKLLNNKDLMIKNLGNLTESLQECEDYIQGVIVSIILSYIQDGKIQPNSEIARALNSCIS